MANTTFTTPGEDRYFEDYVPNAVHEFGPILVDKKEESLFAKRFTPQNTRTESEPFEESFGSLDAYGLIMQLLAEYYLPELNDLSSLKIDKLNWIRPAFPGDKLIVRVTVTRSLRSTEPYSGIAHSFVEVQNQNQEEVMNMRMKTNLFYSPK